MKLILGLFLALIVAGCSSDGEPVLRLNDSDSKDNTSIHGDPKPLYREVTDEFGVGKGWKF